jgi:hypothetical protein
MIALKGYLCIQKVRKGNIRKFIIQANTCTRTVPLLPKTVPQIPKRKTKRGKQAFFFKFDYTKCINSHLPRSPPFLSILFTSIYLGFFFPGEAFVNNSRFFLYIGFFGIVIGKKQFLKC